MDTHSLWKEAIALLEPNVPKQQFLTWFQNTAVLSKIDGLIKLGVPNPYAKAWISDKYAASLLTALQGVDASVREVEIEVDAGLANSDDVRRIDLGKMLAATEKKVRKLPRRPEVRMQVSERTPDGIKGTKLVSCLLNPRYHLDNFVVGQDNRLAHAACSAVAKRPGSEYNPLFVYGGVGLGKTHLLHATGNAILGHNPSAIVVYLPADRFISEIVDAIRNYNGKSLRAKYRNVDCLIVDDIQFLANKDRTQEEFFHIFNELYDGNRQIIVSSDRPPKELDGIEDRLISRFEMGMVVDVHFPDFETRLAILQNKAQERGVMLEMEVAEFIADNIRTSIRELEGVLTKLIGEVELMGKPATVALAADILRKVIGEKDELRGSHILNVIETNIASVDEVIACVARNYHISTVDLTGATRKREHLIPRQVCMYLIRKVLGYSFESIGEYFSGRNHTTVLHAVNKVKKMVQDDDHTRNVILSLKQKLQTA